MNYGKLLRAARDKKGIKANYVAGRLGLSVSSYSALERGRRNLTVERAERIATILGLSLPDLLSQQVSESLNNTGTEGS